MTDPATRRVLSHFVTTPPFHGDRDKAAEPKTMTHAAIGQSLPRLPRVSPSQHRVPWYLDPANSTSERWFAVTDFTDVVAPATGGSRPAGFREDLDMASILTDRAAELAAREDEALTVQAAALHLHAAELRREAGAWPLCVGNYHALTRHHLRRRQWKPAVAYMRKLLFVTAEARAAEPDRLGACLLAAEVYVAVRQVAKARDAAVEAAAIASRMSDAGGLGHAKHLLLQVEALANARPRIGIGGESGREAETCACGEKGAFRECCGVADEVPAEFMVSPRPHGYTSPQASLWKIAGEDGIDLLMDKPGADGECLNWACVRIEDGRYSLTTLPNWSGRAMKAARRLATHSLSDPDATEWPASTVLQVACAVEAFIKAAEHFIGRSPPDRWRHVDLPAIVGPTSVDQGRDGGVRRRWAGIGNALYGPDWSKHERMGDLGDLMALRNSLTHFKGENEEPIAPRMAKPQSLLNRFQGRFAFRDPPRPWIDRILTPGLATWAVDLGDGLIGSFRRSWHEQ